MRNVIAIAALCFTLSGITARAALPPPLPTASRSFDAGSVHVDVYGTAGKPAVMLIPGLTCGPWEFSGIIARLAPNYSIYALTLPGFDGRSAIQAPLFPTVTADIGKLLQSHSIPNPVIIGHSLGGTLGIALAEHYSPDIRGVVAIDGLPIFPGYDKLSVAQREQYATQMSSMIANAATPAQFEAAERTYSLPYMITSPSDVAAVAPLTARSSPSATAAWMKEDLTTDLRPALSAVTVPLLEIAPYDRTLDTRSFPTSAAKQSYYESLLAGDRTARVQMIAPSRHFIMYDQPQRLQAAIDYFLSSLRS